MQIGMGRNLAREYMKGARMKEPVSIHITGHVIVNLEKRGTALEIVIGHWTRTERGPRKEIVGVTVAVVVIEISTRIMDVTMMEERRNGNAHITSIVTMAGTTSKIMSVQAIKIEITCMRWVHMATVSPGMKEIWLVTVRIMATMS